MNLDRWLNVITFFLVLFIIVEVVAYFLFTSVKGVENGVALNKHSFAPGERLVFHLTKCDSDYEYKNIHYQLEQHNGEGISIISLGSNYDVGIPIDGCYEINDLSAKIPDDLLDYDRYVQPGRFRVMVRVDNARNPFDRPSIFISSWFDVVDNN